MITIIRTNSANQDFRELITYLDEDLAIRDGSEHAFYAQFNKVDMINHVVIAYDDNRPVGCGSIKKLTSDSMEVKRMYTAPASRGKGIASTVLRELERWSAELSYKKCILETGNKQPEAIALYFKSGYKVVQNYGQYAGVENSICFEKELGGICE
ncbi:GNAT family N-acetyltransferase [Daejeonella sp.]|uniref:GNAT family N-acetyltransferase n=1 Tax=Daejeonella sp. TaxID=2805397 RepID=UPI0039832E20